MRKLHIIWCIFFSLVSVISVAEASDLKADSQELKQLNVKLSIVYQLTKYIDWQPSPNKELTVCFIGFNKFDDFGPLSKSRTYKDFTLIPHFLFGKQPKVDICNIIYLNHLEKNIILHYLETLSSKPVLTISDTQGFIKDGGMIGLIIDNGSVTIELNAQAIRESGLQVSPALIEIARRVIP